jgi:ComF family protein
MTEEPERNNLSMNFIKSLRELLLNLLFPRRCPVCDHPVAPFDSLVCTSCKQTFTYIKQPYCLKCGKPLAREEQEYCHDCTTHRHLFDRGLALFEYKSVSDSIYRFKYKGRQEYAAYYASCMTKKLQDFITNCQADALIPVPIHKSRRYQRGYNQAEALARELSGLTGIPVVTDLIIRSHKTAPMKDLSASERQNNLKRAFKICRNDVKLSTIIIIDDIYTTGSTIDAMSLELKKAGVKRIYFMTLAIGRGA